LQASLVGATATLGLGDTFSRVGNGRVGLDLPDILRNRTARLRKLDDVLGGGDTFKLYLAEYTNTQSLISNASYSASVGRELLAILAEQAQQAGWAAFDMGDHISAGRLYRESYSIATEAHNDSLTGNALAFLAYQELLENPTVAVGTAEQSCASVSQHAPSSVLALLHERRAWAHAVAGNAAAADAALIAAQEALSNFDGTPREGQGALLVLARGFVPHGRRDRGSGGRSLSNPEPLGGRLLRPASSTTPTDPDAARTTPQRGRRCPSTGAGPRYLASDSPSTLLRNQVRQPSEPATTGTAIISGLSQG
jgi:hypothetical protein